MDEEHLISEQEEQGDEEYSFMNETVKRRPPRIRKILTRAVMLVLAGALFGGTAALVFVRVGGHASLDEKEKVYIEKDEELTADTASVTPTPPVSAPASSDEGGETTLAADEADARKTNSLKTDAKAAAGGQGEAENAADASAIDGTQNGGTQAASNGGQAEPAETGSEAAAGDNGTSGEAAQPEASGTVEASGEEMAEAGSSKEAGVSTDEMEKTEAELNEEALQNYARLNAAMRTIADEADRAVVQVSGITDTEDWFSNISSASRTSSGLIVTETSRELLVLTDSAAVEGAGRVMVTLKDGTITEASVGKSDPLTGLCMIRIAKENIPVPDAEPEEESGEETAGAENAGVENAGAESAADPAAADGSRTDADTDTAAADGTEGPENGVEDGMQDGTGEEAESSWKIADLGNSFDIRTGDSVIAIGSPLGYHNSVVYGEVTSTLSHISLTDGEYSLITTNCIGSPSGSGMLVNLDGKVVGYIMQRYASENSSCVTAVPISLLKDLIEKLSNEEPLGYVGITGESVSEEVSAGIDVPSGVYITGVDPDSPALQAGLVPGDVLTAIGDREISSMWMVHGIVMAAGPGAQLAFTVLRRGTDGDVPFTFTVTVGELS